MEWHVTSADKDRKKFQIRGSVGGKVVKLSGHRDRKIAEMMKDNIIRLSRSKQLNELPDPNLISWIESLPPKETERYIRLGLVERRYMDKRRPIDDLLTDYLLHVQMNRKKQLPTRHPEIVMDQIRRVFEKLGPNATFSNLEADKVLEAIDGFETKSGARKGERLSQKTRREYIVAMKSFTRWMVNTGKASMDPLCMLKAPAAKAAPVRERRPLSREEFAQLIDYLWNAPDEYSHQMFAWTPHDRLILYWFAVETGFRMNELRSLTRAHFNFDCQPARVTVEARVAKNGTKATMPIGSAIGAALFAYCGHLQPKSPVFRMPGQDSLTNAFHRDLDAAGVRRKFDDGSMVDFHALRSTAILWWLKYHKLDILDVQRRARLMTLSLVQEYVRKYAPNHDELVQNTPTVLDPNLPLNRLRKRGA